MKASAQPPDVLVVGSGVIGASIAYELASRGRRVVALDARGPGDGATQASAGVLAPFIEGHRRGVLRSLCAESLRLYPEFISRVATDSGQAIVFERSGSLTVAIGSEQEELLGEAAHLLEGDGIRCELVNGDEARRAEPALSSAVGAGLHIPDHALVAARQLTSALVAAGAARGVTFVPARRVVKLEAGADGITVTSVGELSFSARHVVIAAGSWGASIDIGRDKARVPVRPVKGQLVCLRLRRAQFHRVIWGSRCYLVPWPDGTVLVGGTVEDVGFDERPTADALAELLSAATELVPEVGRASFEAIRVGLRPMMPDELPLVGQSSHTPGLLYALGHYRNGVMLAPLTAKLIGDLIVNETSDTLLDAVAPQRFGEL